MVWQNARREQHWIPVKGDAQLEDFKAFHRDPKMVFGDRIGPMYGVNVKKE